MYCNQRYSFFILLMNVIWANFNWDSIYMYLCIYIYMYVCMYVRVCVCVSYLAHTWTFAIPTGLKDFFSNITRFWSFRIVIHRAKLAHVKPCESAKARKKKKNTSQANQFPTKRIWWVGGYNSWDETAYPSNKGTSCFRKCSMNLPPFQDIMMV